MLSQLIRNSRRLALLLPFSFATTTSSKILAEKKKKIYQTQTIVDLQQPQNSPTIPSEEEGER